MTTLFGSKPQLAATIALGWASIILPDSYLAANPPNTIEWTAPILAQAHVANKASGIIGM